MRPLVFRWTRLSDARSTKREREPLPNSGVMVVATVIIRSSNHNTSNTKDSNRKNNGSNSSDSQAPPRRQTPLRNEA